MTSTAALYSLSQEASKLLGRPQIQLSHAR
jgi:hypothetical protein